MKQANVCKELSAAPGTEEALVQGSVTMQWIFKDEEDDRGSQP